MKNVIVRVLSCIEYSLLVCLECNTVTLNHYTQCLYAKFSQTCKKMERKRHLFKKKWYEVHLVQFACLELFVASWVFLKSLSDVQQGKGREWQRQRVNPLMSCSLFCLTSWGCTYTSSVTCVFLFFFRKLVKYRHCKS